MEVHIISTVRENMREKTRSRPIYRKYEREKNMDIVGTEIS